MNLICRFISLFKTTISATLHREVLNVVSTVVQEVYKRRVFVCGIFYWSRCIVGREVRQAFRHKRPFLTAN